MDTSELEEAIVWLVYDLYGLLSFTRQGILSSFTSEERRSILLESIGATPPPSY